MCDGHEFGKSTHFADVLFFVHAVNNRTRTQEKEGFEEGMSCDVEKCNSVGTKTERYKHEA